MVVLTSLGPFTGQAHHWTELAPEKPEAARRHTVGLVERVYRLLDGRLATVPYLGGAGVFHRRHRAYPWVAKRHWAEMRLEDWPPSRALVRRCRRATGRAARHAGAGRRAARLKRRARSEAQPVPPERILRMVPNADLQTLDPINTTAGVVQSHAHMVYDQLFGRDAQQRPQPQMVGATASRPTG
jgi:hypothetical protein